MKYSNPTQYVSDLVSRVSNVLKFSNPCHDPNSGEFCELGHSKYGDRGKPTEDQRKFNGTVHIPSKAAWLTDISKISTPTRERLKKAGDFIVKVGDRILDPSGTDHAVYRATQLGIGEMLQKDILKKIVETKTGDYHEDKRPGKDPRYDYTLGDLPIKVGLTIGSDGHVATIIATHEALDREARRKVNASRGRGGEPDPVVAKEAANEKRAKALELMNQWRVAHKLPPVELIEP